MKNRERLFPAWAVVVGLCSSSAALAQGWVINEIHADPGQFTGDANGDGSSNADDDEFVEIINASYDKVDISGWTLSDGEAVRHQFPAGTILAPYCGIVVFGGGDPAGSFGDSLVQTTDTLALDNAGDTVSLNDGSTDVATVTYGLEGADDQSITLFPDVTGEPPMLKHLVVSSARYSPGKTVSGETFCRLIFSSGFDPDDMPWSSTEP